MEADPSTTSAAVKLEPNQLEATESAIDIEVALLRAGGGDPGGVLGIGQVINRILRKVLPEESGTGQQNGAENMESDEERAEREQFERNIIRELELLFLSPSEDGVILRRLMADGEGLGDEKRLIHFERIYFAFLEDELDKVVIYSYLRATLRQLEGLRSCVKRTVDAIVTNKKASAYWSQMSLLIGKGIKELGTFITAHSSKLGEIKELEKKELEINMLLTAVNGKSSRAELLEKMEQLKVDIGVLKLRAEVLNEEVKKRKQVLDQLCILSKKLVDEDEKTVTDTILEIEEKQVLSDVSMELE